MITAKCIDHMGSDLSVVNAARVSFDKESDWEWVLKPDAKFIETTRRLSDRDTKLIHYLAKHNHRSPFAHAFASFRVNAPIFVARQLQKHTVGLAWNEVSRRYVDAEPTFYVPETWRKRAENVKQGSSDEVLTGLDHDAVDYRYHTFLSEVRTIYHRWLLVDGICPEQARMVLPQSMMTEWIWSGSVYAFARVYNLRTDPHAQKECQTVAYAIGNELKELFPVSWEALTTKKD